MLVAAVLVSIAVYLFGYTVGRIHRRIRFNRFGLSVLVAASLSGCLTATKLHRWESALLTWHRRGDAVCKEAVKPASKYLKAANDRLNNPANRVEDIESDGEAKKLMTEAAAKCGEVVP